MQSAECNVFFTLCKASRLLNKFFCNLERFRVRTEGKKYGSKLGIKLVFRLVLGNLGLR